MRQQNSEKRRGKVEEEHQQHAIKESEEKKRFAQEQAHYDALARGDYQRPYQQADPLTIRAQVPDEDSIPAVSMKLL